MASWFPSRRRPTDGNFIQRHAEAVATRHNVTVLHCITDEQLEKGKTEWEEKQENDVSILIGYIGQKSSPFARWKDYFKAYKEGWDKLPQPPDIIHLNVIFPAGLFALYFSKKYKIPFIISEHWTGYHFPQSSQTPAWKWRIQKLIAQKASFLCPVSEDLANSMRKLGFSGHFEIVPNVVNTEVFSFEPKKEIETLQVLHVSTLIDQHKNVSGIIKSIAQLKQKGIPVKLNLVGDGDLKPHQNLANQLELDATHIEFFGPQTPAQIAEFMQKSHVFVLFSNYENLPCVILESFATGTPVISTNVGGIAEHFPAYSGLLIPPKNEEELIKAILQLQENYTDINLHKIREYATTHFSVEEISLQFETLYRKSVSENK